jgi:hypothetical protein
MATSLDTFAARLIKHVPSCPAFAIKPEVLETIQDFCRKTWALKTLFEYPVTQGEPNTYANKSVIIYTGQIVPECKVVGVAKFYQDGSEYEVEYMPFKSDLTFMDTLFSEAGKKYYDFPAIQQIRFFPFEAASCKLTIEAAFAPVDGVTKVDEDLYYNHFEAIKWGTLARLHEIPGKPWTNYDLARRRQRQYEREAGGVVVQRQHREKGRTGPKRKSFI